MVSCRGELQVVVAGWQGWEGRAGKGGVWGGTTNSWACSESSAITGHVVGRAAVGWYLPVLVVDVERLSRNGVRTQSQNLLTYFFPFGAFAALAKAFAGNEFGQNPRGCGLNSGRASPPGIF